MHFEKAHDGGLDIRSFLKRGIPLSRFKVGQTVFRLSGDEAGGDGRKDLPVCRDDVWQDMLRMALGRVPEGAEHAPPCGCEIFPAMEKYDFSGLAGLPPSVRLMDGFFPVRDQSKRGACFAFALVALCEYMLGKTVELSEQSLFHFTKLVTPGKVENLDDGAIIPDSIRAVEEFGICPLSEWHYNPESWNWVEDAYNEGQGKALQRKLESAQKYRFRHWRRLSNGSVLQFKQALSAGFPIYTGVFVTTDWDAGEVRRTGVIPFPKLVWNIRVTPPPRGLVERIMAENGIDNEAEDVDAAAMQIAGNLIQDTINYVATAVFGCDLSVCGVNESEDRIELTVLLDKIRGGHALCLAGYADDNSFPGGGYFIARNSWSEDKWAPDSPEMPGYALIPYAYIAAYGQQHEGMVMSEFPNETQPAVALPSAAFGKTPAAGAMSMPAACSAPSGGRADIHKNPLTVAAAPLQQPLTATPHKVRPAGPPVSPGAGFETWLAARKSVLSRPARDAEGVLLRPGTPVLVPDPSQPDNILRDIPENRAKLRVEHEKGVAALENAALRDAVREIADEAFARQTLILSMEAIRDELAAKGFGQVALKAVRSMLLEMQKKDPAIYAVCINQFGREEFRHASAIGERVRVTA